MYFFYIYPICTCSQFSCDSTLPAVTFQLVQWENSTHAWDNITDVAARESGTLTPELLLKRSSSGLVRELVMLSGFQGALVLSSLQLSSSRAWCSALSAQQHLEL